MKSHIFLWCSVVFACVISSCQKDELPVPKHDAGDVLTTSVNMETDYRWQIYVDLKSNTIAGKNLKTAWDMGFETSEDGYRVVLNSSKAMYAFMTGTTDFQTPTDTLGFESRKKFDAPSGNLDSTALGNWKSYGNVYVIDRGFDEAGKPQGFRKIKIEEVTKEKYTVRYANIDGSGEHVLDIPKKAEYNFTFLSFTTHAVELIEPPKANWSIVFTQYLEDLGTPYLVTGCLLNRFNTSAVMDSSVLFKDITFAYATASTLNSHLETIGYNWKYYYFSSAKYVVLPKMNYVIKDNGGFYYKLHFIDFYNSAGAKGNPKFEFQRL